MYRLFAVSKQGVHENQADALFPQHLRCGPDGGGRTKTVDDICARTCCHELSCWHEEANRVSAKIRRVRIFLFLLSRSQPRIYQCLTLTIYILWCQGVGRHHGGYGLLLFLAIS